MINEENDQKQLRWQQLQELVETVNDNVTNSTKISFSALKQNPKLVSYKLMKLDMEQSCRAQCSIDREEAPADAKI